MSQTPSLGLPLITASQSQKHVTHNEALMRLDALTQLRVIDRSLSTPPEAPSEGDCYIVGSNPTDAWQDKQGFLATYQTGAWLFIEAFEGLRAWIVSERALIVWNGSNWAPIASNNNNGGDALSLVDFLGINTTADTANRLAVKSDATLFSHDDVTPGTGDTRMVFNKSSDAHTASLLYQTNWSGRAEMGLTGNDDFSVKVSSDGASWRNALTIDRQSGDIALSSGFSYAGGATIEAVAEAFANGLQTRLKAESGDPAATPHVLMASNVLGASNLFLASCADNNILEIDGHYVKTLSKGEAFNGEYTAGVVIRSTKGVYGVSKYKENPLPLATEAFAARQFFFFAFRNSSANRGGAVFVSTGAIPASVELKSGDGATTVQGPVKLGAYSLTKFSTNANSEFQLIADQPVFAALCANDETPTVFDARLITPLTTELIVHLDNCHVSALHDNTDITVYQQNGTIETYTISPGAAQVFSGSSNAGYPSDKFAIIRASGPISAFSGADGFGSEATAGFPLNTLSQVIPLPLKSAGVDSSPRASIIVASPYEGTATIHWSDGSVAETLILRRSGSISSPAVNVSEQLHPAAARWIIPAELDFGPGGWVEADVPIYVVQNANDPGGDGWSGDEVALIGITPNDKRAEIRRDASGLLRRRSLDPNGVTTWQVC